MGQKILSAFTEKYNNIQKKIINNAVVVASETYEPVIAQWDTGATGTCISKEIVQKFCLAPIGRVNVQTPSGIGVMNNYLIDLVLNNEVLFHNIPVMDSEIGKQGIDVLIGMDIISEGDFAISNYNGKTQFSFRIPSRKAVDYKQDTCGLA